MIYTILKHSHSGIRWIALLFLILALINSLINLAGNKSYSPIDKKFSLYALIASHLQLILGFILFMISPKVIFSADSMSNSMLRFFLIEHTSLMLLAIVLVTIGYSKSKKSSIDKRKHSHIAIFYGTALILIFLAIPWPWRNLGAGWF